jgi:hypothetical protein
LTLCFGLEVQKTTQALKSVKGPGNSFDLIKPQLVKNFAVLNIFVIGYLKRPPSIKKIKYQC